MNLDPSPLKLEDVIINSELIKRPAKAPNYEVENQALAALAEAFANAPDTILQKLAETALELCGADTAGISLLDEKDGAEVFRWEALAGVFRDRRNSTMPRNASPCGTTIDRNATQLMYMAERVFPALMSIPPVVEALLIPFHVDNRPVGTVWVVAHDECRKFDREDERTVKTLARFASAAWQLWRARAAAESAVTIEQQRALDLSATNAALVAHLEYKKKAEEQLHQLNSELQARITDHTTELTLSHPDMTETIAGIAHDFNNILHVIQGYAALIMRHPSEQSHVVANAEVIAATVDAGAVLARQLLNRETNFSRVDINELLHRAGQLLAPMFPATIVIATSLDARLPMLLLDEGLINQAVLNLCLNARDAMPDGGQILLQTRATPGTVVREKFPEANAERYIEIIVGDTGTGMEAEVKRRVFESRFTTKKSGAGLGLSSVHGIIRQHAGFIGVTSAPGCGSTFHIFLPIRSDPREAADNPALLGQTSADNPTPRRETILYAEDESRLALLLRHLLEKEGLKVLTVQDWAEAVEVYSRHQDEIGVAILDSGMAKLNGWEAFQQMRKLNPKLKGILASGYVSTEAEAQVANGQLWGVLQKPYVGAEVIALVKRAIRSQ
jgi:signal transduction histidine kinase